MWVFSNRDVFDLLTPDNSEAFLGEIPLFLNLIYSRTLTLSFFPPFFFTVNSYEALENAFVSVIPEFINCLADFTKIFISSKVKPLLLKDATNPSVINIGSIYGVLGPDWSLYNSSDIKGTPAAYAASKGGLIQLTRWLATSLAPSVRVNAIVPGGVERDTPVRFKQEYEKRTPLKRLAKEEDVKGVSVFLASDASSYITGQCIMVDGGWSVW